MSSKAFDDLTKIAIAQASSITEEIYVDEELDRNRPVFEVVTCIEDNETSYRWRMRAGHNRQIAAVSPRGFTKPSEASASIRRVMSAFADPGPVAIIYLDVNERLVSSGMLRRITKRS
jgi:hypothetical protein